MTASRHPRDSSNGPEPALDGVRTSGAPPLVELGMLAAGGDPAATARLLRQVAPEMARVVRGVVGSNAADVDDALQQALVGLVQALPAFRGECSPAGYACRIAFRAALRCRRGAHAARAQLQSLADDDFESLEELPSDRPDARQRTTVLRSLLEDLPDEQAEALALRTMLGWTLDEIARTTGAPANTVRSRLRLAKEALRRRIEADPLLAEQLGVEP